MEQFWRRYMYVTLPCLWWPSLPEKSHGKWLQMLKALRHGPPTQSDYVHFSVHNVVPRRLGMRPTVYVRAANLPARVKRSRRCLCSSSTASLHAQLPHLDVEPSTNLWHGKRPGTGMCTFTNIQIPAVLVERKLGPMGFDYWSWPVLRPNCGRRGRAVS